MIEIIEEAKPFVIRCKKCGCKFQYEYTDLNIAVPRQIECPVCGEFNIHIVKDDEPLTLGLTDDIIPFIPTHNPAMPSVWYQTTCKNEVAQ